MTGVDLDLAQLRALDATVTAGTLDGRRPGPARDARAISQRLKALEAATGRVLLVRSKPVQVTESGQAVLRLARQVALLAADAARELAGTGSGPVDAAHRAQRRLDGHLGAARPGPAGRRVLLRPAPRGPGAHQRRCSARARVMAAVTADAVPVPGCTVTRLGGMRYRPMATRGLRRPVVPRRGHDGGAGRGPGRGLRPQGRPPARATCASAVWTPPARRCTTSRPRPTTSTAVRLGFGWGMVPAQQEPPAGAGRARPGRRGRRRPVLAAVAAALTDAGPGGRGGPGRRAARAGPVALGAQRLGLRHPLAGGPHDRRPRTRGRHRQRRLPERLQRRRWPRRRSARARAASTAGGPSGGSVAAPARPACSTPGGRG